MKIISIEKNQKVSSVCTVLLDNNISFSLPKKRIELLELKEGSSLSEETLNYILDTEVYAAARSAAVSFLAMKLRSSWEVSQRLFDMGYEEVVVERVIESLREIGYIDDLDYSRKYISEKTKLKPKASRLLAMELSRRGIPENIIETALDECALDESRLALELLRKRYSRFTYFDDKLIQKMKAFLTGRGFSYSQVSKAISSFLPEE
ncbi:regulatory protein RecX [Ruminiclostridium hungatei]|uniref:Regulatory protein RecX n=1 Tax=Ruminiclostridium hungatei TaxID=48256 RepID=A0A1V4SIA6_RUMHU|nr:regulatory protein RecX [Ruminiclostridium hungatei]OPX43195.1 regulatory protein RecX [Ruminiclostridium hungatei]